MLKSEHHGRGSVVLRTGRLGGIACANLYLWGLFWVIVRLTGFKTT